MTKTPPIDFETDYDEPPHRESPSAQLARLSERAKALDERLTDRARALDEKITERVKMLDDKISAIKVIVEKLDVTFNRYESQGLNLFVTKLEYEPIRKLVYGAVGFILITVLSSFTLMVVRSSTDKITTLPIAGIVQK